jgi:hypothetical protein
MEFANLDAEVTETVLRPDDNLSTFPLHSRQQDPAPNLTLISLPTEILLRITYFLTLPPHRVAPVYGLLAGKPGLLAEARTDTLKNIRLVHPLLSQLPVPYLFSHVTVPLWGDRGLIRLHDIASQDHLARYVQHLKVYVKFKVAPPRAISFSESLAARDNEVDLLGRVPAPRKRDQLRRKVSNTIDKLPFDRLKGKGKKSSIPNDAEKASPIASKVNDDEGLETVRSTSVASASSDTDQQFDSRWSHPNPRTRPKEFLTMFESMATATLSHNLNVSERDLPRSLEHGSQPSANQSMSDPSSSTHSTKYPSRPPPMLLALSRLMSSIYSAMPRLQTLCIDSQLQEEFMGKLDRALALRFTSIQETWDAMSGYVVAMLIAGWAVSDTNSVRRLWALGGSTEWPLRLREYLHLDLYQSTDEQTCNKSSSKQSSLTSWRQKAANIESLALKYDLGAYKKNFEHVQDSWIPSIANFLDVMPNLQFLDLAAQSRSDGFERTNKEAHPSLAKLILSEPGSSSYLPSALIITANPTTLQSRNPKLRLLRLADFRSCCPSHFVDTLNTLTGPNLQDLRLGNFSLTSPPGGETGHALGFYATWASAWKALSDEPQFRLRNFMLIGTTYIDNQGRWTKYPGMTNVDGRESLEAGIRRWVCTQSRESQAVDQEVKFPLPTREEVGDVVACREWSRVGDEGMRFRMGNI